MDSAPHSEREHDQEESSHHRLARWLIAHEMGSDTGAIRSVPEAAERACRRLLYRLAKLITPLGCQALVSRALHLVGADFPFLREIKLSAAADVLVEGLASSAEGTVLDQARAGLTAFLGTLIGLVALFIGEQLLARMLIEIWPDLAARQ